MVYRWLGPLVVLLAIGAVALNGQANPDPWPELVPVAEDVVDRLASGDVEPIVALFTEQMAAALTAEQLRGIFPALAAQVGAFERRGGHVSVARDPARVIVASTIFERGRFNVQVAFDADGRIAGLFVVPQPPAVAWTPPDYADLAAFRTEDVTVDAGGWPLPGTLTMPVGDGPFPAVVLVHGSGPNDRDETIGPNKPFRDLAEGLSSRGIAVLRYEKRTREHGARLAGIENFTTRDEVVDDAVAAVTHLRGRTDIRANEIFVLGHSLGGMLAPRIAAAAPDITGLIFLAAAAQPVQDALVYQSQYLAFLDGELSSEERAQLETVEQLRDRIYTLQPGDPPIDLPPFSGPASYWIDLRDYDAPAEATQLSLPVLVLHGERDYQVTEADYYAWEAAFSAHPNAFFRTYPGLNHLLMAGTGPGSPQEYLQPGHVSAQVVADITSWITGR
jgi:dienelactone hydrolase